MPSKTFKYLEWMTPLKIPCPPEEFEEKELEAFRWVYDSIEDEKSFLPQYFKKPERFHGKSDFIKCQAMAISLFDSEGHAIRKFCELKSRLKDRIYRDLGTHLAKGTIIPDFGVSDRPNHSGHFSFHPYETIDISQHFQIISAFKSVCGDE